VQLLVGILVVCASYGAGAAVTRRRLPIADALRRETTTFAIGFGVLQLLALFFGVVGVFRPAVLGTVAVLFGVPGFLLLVRGAGRLPAIWRGLGRARAFLAIAAAIAVVDVVLAAAPPTSGDALAYHLTAPKLWLHAHRMWAIWWNWPTFQPLGVEMHFAYAQALWDGAAASVTGALLAAVGTVAIYGLAREVADARVAAVAALLWVGQGMFLWEATGAFIDLPLSALVALAVWHAVVYVRRRAPADLGWAGLAVGLAASTKIHALLALALALCVFAVPSARRRALALFAAGAAVAIPWYLRTLVLTGNPFYPLVFGGKYWNANAQADYTHEWKGDGIHGIWHLPFFPLEFVLQTSHYERGYSFSVALFVLAPLVFLFVRRGWVRWFSLAIVIYLVLWWQGMHQATRYLLPVLALAAPMAGLAAVRLWESRWGRVLVGAAAAVSAALLVVITGLYARQVVPVIVGTESTQHFTQRLVGDTDAFRWLDTRLPKGRVVALMGVRNSYWVNRPYVLYREPLYASGNPPAVQRARLVAAHVRYIAYEGGTPPKWLMPELRQITTLQAKVVTSRTLGRTAGYPDVVRVYEWLRR
jgi:4-amino-4-deoxy-L-arabinose transferase-like glycosyltransferase